ncbi:hypothetical protein BJV82DRAFT_635805 [Fennellomyces sp. T-0311]|nr:hypothetical protein BJV82DRAFT_635805 [Fennellomyces sp. T-0311]
MMWVMDLGCIISVLNYLQSGNVVLAVISREITGDIRSTRETDTFLPSLESVILAIVGLDRRYMYFPKMAILSTK